MLSAAEEVRALKGYGCVWKRDAVGAAVDDAAIASKNDAGEA